MTLATTAQRLSPTLPDQCSTLFQVSDGEARSIAAVEWVRLLVERHQIGVSREPSILANLFSCRLNLGSPMDVPLVHCETHRRPGIGRLAEGRKGAKRHETRDGSHRNETHTVGEICSQLYEYEQALKARTVVSTKGLRKHREVSTVHSGEGCVCDLCSMAGLRLLSHASNGEDT